MRLASWIVAVSLAALPALAGAQSYPARTVKVVVPLSTGSASDTFTRIVAQKLNESWGNLVVVENQPGANGIPATLGVVKSAPDGYTLITLAANHVINASLYRSLPFDTLKDVRPVVRLGFTPLVLCLHPSIPAKSMKELIALLKSRPGQLNYGSAGNGSVTHLAGEMMKTMAGINMQHVPYKAISQAQTDLIGGQLDLMFVVPSVAIQQVAAGRFRAIGIASLKRMPQLPDVPTIDESGLKGFEALPWIGIGAPSGVPEDVVNRISAEVLKVLAMPDVQSRISGLGLLPDGQPAKEFADYMARDQAKWAKVVKESGAKIE